MAKRAASRRTCSEGHTYTKVTDCPTCPVCEREKAKAGFFVDGLTAPPRRALLSQGIDSLKALSRYSEKEILALHGMGPSSLPAMRKALQAAGLGFRP